MFAYWTLSRASFVLLVGLFALQIATNQAEAWWFGESEVGKAPGSAADQQQAAQIAPAPIGNGPVKAEARFDMEGVSGLFAFSQEAAGKPVLISYDLSNLKGNNQLYHVHVGPVPQIEPSMKALNGSQFCSSASVGGHLNPSGVKYTPGIKPEKFELGDLSGKFGPLMAKGEDHYAGDFSDTELELRGPNGIIGRSIVIHKSAGPRWVCANILEVSA